MRSQTFGTPLLCAGLALGLALAGSLPAAVAAQVSTGGAATATSGSPAQNYLVLYRSGGTATGKSLDAIKRAGGTLVKAYDAIGVAVVSTAASDFSARLRAADPSVEAASGTAGFGVALGAGAATGDAMAEVPADLAPPVPAPGSDNLSGLQWDMDQINAPQARAINGGSRSVVVGDLDTGLDWGHPDLAPNVDFSRSASCQTGAANQDRDAWMDHNGHGTHTAGTIAAAKNGIGIVGVAPNVKIAGIKTSNDDGLFFPEMVVCAFMWAAEKGIQVTNNSYFADPWLFNCKDDPQQRAIWEAERRAIRYAQSNGVTVVASAGNQSDDLAHPTQDVTSPDYPAGSEVTREITNACAVVPAEVPGVVTVSATGDLSLKSFYSSYGTGVVDVAAPGGDSRLQITPAAPNGRVLSTYPASMLSVTCPAARRVVDASGATYCYLQGTSMAGPHVAGVAALVASTGANPGQVVSRLTSTATPLACPADMTIYEPFPAVDNGAPQECTGSPSYNSFYGRGKVNALAAIGG